ncbi:MAG: transposase, partial [Chitinophagaceae bacterium]|nr:transposase [Chitinophagaceae bacterium]
HYTQFITVTNLNWLHLLENEYHKQILIEALKRRVELEQVTIYAFVIMPNHFHALWQLHDNIDETVFQRDLLKFTARSLLNFMRMNNDPLLTQLQVKAADRQQQVWERNSLRIDIWNEKVFLQKMNYIHNNPVHPKWRLAEVPQDYKYSSASFYETGKDAFEFLTHYLG